MNKSKDVIRREKEREAKSQSEKQHNDEIQSFKKLCENVKTFINDNRYKGYKLILETLLNDSKHNRTRLINDIKSNDEYLRKAIIYDTEIRVYETLLTMPDDMIRKLKDLEEKN